MLSHTHTCANADTSVSSRAADSSMEKNEGIKDVFGICFDCSDFDCI